MDPANGLGPGRMQSCPYIVNKRYLHTESGLPLTVKYVGPLPPSAPKECGATTRNTTWIGVEWDDPTRGKHSGTFQNVQVFQTRVPGAASFLKYKPARRTANNSDKCSAGTPAIKNTRGMLDAGKGFFQAVYERYIDSELDHSATTEGAGVDDSSLSGSTASNKAHRHYPTATHKVDKIVLGSSNGQILVEMPNIDKVVRKLRRGVGATAADSEGSTLGVKEIGLEGAWVYGVERADGEADTIGDIENLAHRRSLEGRLNNVHTLNLSRNLLSDWNELAAICVELPNLEVLVVNFSRMEPLHLPLADSLPEKLRAAFAKIEQLHVCYSLLSWVDVRHLTTAFPSLRTLDLAGNPLLQNAVSIDTACVKQGLAEVRSLDLTACALSKWEDMLEILRQTPDLCGLNVSSNPLPTIDFVSTPTTRLPRLDTIILNDTQVVDWQSIDNLQGTFGSSLRTFKYSLSQDFQDAERQATKPEQQERKTFTGRIDDRVYLIAKLPGLETLNGTAITKQERSDAERFYLAQAAKELGADVDQKPGWGRLKDLKEIHGGSESAVSRPFLSTTLKSKMIDIAVECRDLGLEPFTLSVLPTAPIKLLKGKIARQLGVPISSDFRLSVMEAGASHEREISESDRANVSSLDMKEGDILLVELK